MENGDLEFLQKREHTFETSMFCIDRKNTPSDNTGNSNLHKHGRLNENKEVFCTQKNSQLPTALFFFREKVSFPGATFTFTHFFLQRLVLCNKVAHQQMSFILKKI